MAILLQRQYSLPVVRVTLSELETAPAVRVELVLNIEGEPHVDGEQTHGLELFGFTDSAECRDLQLSVPEELAEWVGSWVAARLDPDDVLWLHLVKPYGQLGAVPWERQLQPAAGIPVLRLPDALPGEERAGSTCHVALCATLPDPDGSSTASMMVPPAARALVGAMGDRLHLHLYPDPDAHDHLQSELADLAGRVTFYRADDDFEKQLEPTPGLDNLWLRWMRQTMGGRAFDAVHFIVHGYALGTAGAMLTTSTPTSLDRMYPQKVQAGELRTFLTHVGADIAGFTTPFDNYSDYGLLKIADELGAIRAGPVLLHDARPDHEMALLGSAYAFLTGVGVRKPPADPALMLFAQPRQVVTGEEEAEVAEPEVEPSILAPSEAVSTYLSQDETPAWVAASQQYIKEREAELIRFDESRAVQTPTSAQVAYYTGLESSLHKIKAVVDKHAEAELWRTSS